MHAPHAHSPAPMPQITRPVAYAPSYAPVAQPVRRPIEPPVHRRPMPTLPRLQAPPVPLPAAPLGALDVTQMMRRYAA